MSGVDFHYADGVFVKAITIGRFSFRRVHKVQTRDDLSIGVAGKQMKRVAVIPPIRQPFAAVNALPILCVRSNGRCE